MVSSQSLHTYKPFGLVEWIFQALVGCHDILILGKRPIKWGQRPDMTLAVDWDVSYSCTRNATTSIGPRPLGPKEIDGLFVSPGKASSLLTDHLITGYPLRSELAQEKWFQVEASIPISLFGLVEWIFQALVGCHDILILGKSPIKLSQRPDMTLAVDWDVLCINSNKQTNKSNNEYVLMWTSQLF